MRRTTLDSTPFSHLPSFDMISLEYEQLLICPFDNELILDPKHAYHDRTVNVWYHNREESQMLDEAEWFAETLIRNEDLACEEDPYACE